jgi:hypothetical protein
VWYSTIVIMFVVMELAHLIEVVRMTQNAPTFDKFVAYGDT